MKAKAEVWIKHPLKFYNVPEDFEYIFFVVDVVVVFIFIFFVLVVTPSIHEIYDYRKSLSLPKAIPTPKTMMSPNLTYEGFGLLGSRLRC